MPVQRNRSHASAQLHVTIWSRLHPKKSIEIIGLAFWSSGWHAASDVVVLSLLETGLASGNLLFKHGEGLRSRD